MGQSPGSAAPKCMWPPSAFLAGFLLLTLLRPIPLLGHPLSLQEPVTPPPAAPDSTPQQLTATPEKPPSAPAAEEVVTRDAATTFKVRVNLLLVRVVVREERGKVIETVKKEDFLLFDSLNRQSIS